MMVTIVWNSTRFYQMVALPKGMKFNADYCIARILDPLAEWRRIQVGGSDRRLHVHADNARPHIAKKVTEFQTHKAMKRAPTRRIHRIWHRATSAVLRTSKEGLQVHHSRSPINFCRRLMRLFNPLKSHIGTCVSGVDGQIGATLCGSWWFRRRCVKSVRMIQVLLDQFRDSN
jgi:hypothetical protein